MSDITLFVNNKQVNPSEKTARAYAAILTTDNPGSDTVVKAISDASANPAAWIASFESAGTESDEFRVVTVGSRKNAKVTTTGIGTRAILANRMKLALDAKNWQVSITRVVEGETENKKTVDTSDVEIF